MTRTAKTIGVVLYVGLAVRSGAAIDEHAHAGMLAVLVIAAGYVGLFWLATKATARHPGTATGSAMGLLIVVTTFTPEFFIFVREGESGDWIVVPVLGLVAIAVDPIYRWRFRPARAHEPTVAQRRVAADAARRARSSAPFRAGDGAGETADETPSRKPSRLLAVDVPDGASRARPIPRAESAGTPVMVPALIAAILYPALSSPARTSPGPTRARSPRAAGASAHNESSCRSTRPRRPPPRRSAPAGAWP